MRSVARKHDATAWIGVAGALATLAILGAVEGFPPGAPALEDGFVVRNSPAFSCHPKTTTGTPC